MLIGIILLELYNFVYDNVPIYEAEELTKRTWIRYYITEEKVIKMEIQDIILLQGIWNHGISLLRGENPGPLAFHWNKNGLLCKRLTWYEVRFEWSWSDKKSKRDAKIRDYEDNLMNFVGNKDSLFDLDNSLVIKKGYQLD